MREMVGNIWDYWQKKWIVVTTNIGYRPAKDNETEAGPCPMGAGLAKDLAERAPHIPYIYGIFCHKWQAHTPTMWRPEGVILFPTKPLNAEQPWLSWKSKSNMVLVERSLRELATLKIPDRAYLATLARSADIDNDEILVPLVGCKNGKLTEKQVLPLMKEILDDRFVLVREPPTVHPF